MVECIRKGLHARAACEAGFFTKSNMFHDNLLKDVWWKHLAEIAFHIHPEDATDEIQELMIDLCQEYDVFGSVLSLFLGVC